MLLTCLGSSSLGNCYLFEAADGEVLVLEAGIPFSEVKHALRFQLRRVSGCIVTHEHNDHAKFLPDFLKAGIRVYALPFVFDALGVGRKAFTEGIQPRTPFKVGTFKVQGFAVEHDVPCLCYIITHREMGNLLFITDTMMLGRHDPESGRTISYKFPNLNQIMIEANYSDAILSANIANGSVPEAMRPRLMRSHLELGTTCSILRAHDLSRVNNVILVHLSNQNSSAVQFTTEVQKVAGKPVCVADTGFQRELNLLPY